MNEWVGLLYRRERESDIVDDLGEALTRDMGLMASYLGRSYFYFFDFEIVEVAERIR